MIKLKKRLIPYYEWFATNLFTKRIVASSQPTAYIFMTANYNNIGDLAINYAQEKFIERTCPDYRIVSIAITDTYKYLKSIKKTLKSTDLILLQGGGNFGDLYPIADFGRLFLCKFFADHRVISFPQTIVFSDTEYGRWRFAKNQKVLSGHQNLTLFAREKISYKMMRDAFGTDKVQLSPDIVLSLLATIREEEDAAALDMRKSVVMTLRSDAEKKVSAEQQSLLQDMVESNYRDVVYKDTEFVGISPQTVDEGYEKVQEVFKVYQSAKVVVTDRLHGMIFAAVTGTPCIVLPNSNHKISETYKNWLQQCNYIRFIDSADTQEVKDLIDYFMGDTFKTNYQDVSLSFAAMKKSLREAARS